MTRLLAIDPGPVESAYVIIDTADCRPIEFGKLPNADLMQRLHGGDIALNPPRVAIEMIASYGMPVGADVFETCVHIGRFAQFLETRIDTPIDFIKRHPVKIHHCHSSKANDSNIRRALADRFAPRTANFGKGSKAEPGFFYGFHSDIWAAFAVAVYAADHLNNTEH